MPTTFSWTDEVRAAHAELSPFQASWLDFVAQRPEALAPEAFDLDRYGEIQPEKIQPWPLFAGAESLRSIAEGVRDVMRLVGTIPLRIFGGEPDRIADFYGCTVDLARRVMTLIEGGCLPHLVARGDFLGGPQSFACCEMNVAGNLGGWQVGHWAERIAASPLVAEFLARERLRVSGTHPIRALFEHAAAVGVARGLAAEGELTLALVTRGRVLPLLVKDAARLWSQILESAGVGAGRFLICDERELTEERGRTFLRGLRVHLFVDWGEEMKEGPIYRTQAAGQGFCFNGLVDPILSDKRNLALLSEQSEGDLYSAADRALIARHIPWTRLLVEDYTDRAGDRVFLPEYVRQHRQHLVIKPGTGLGGKDVFVGPALGQDEWEARLDGALAAGTFLVQDFVPTSSYLFQAKEGGAAPHEIVWGSLLFGDRFGPLVLRGAVRGAGAVNIHRGARYIVLLEVERAA